MKNMKKKTYIESEIDKFLEKHEDENISIIYDENKNKFDTEEITKSLKNIRNKLINLGEFKEEYNKFTDNVKKFEDYKSKKRKVVFLKTKKNEKICNRFRRYC